MASIEAKWTARERHRKDRRTRRQADVMLRAAVLAAEGPLDDFTTQDRREVRKGRQRRKIEGDGE